MGNWFSIFLAVRIEVAPLTAPSLVAGSGERGCTVHNAQSSILFVIVALLVHG